MSSTEWRMVIVLVDILDDCTLEQSAKGVYRKISNIRRTKSSHLNVSRLVLQLSLPNRMKPGVKSRMKM